MACSWNLRGHSKSLNVPPVDRSCRTSYQSTNATIALFSIYLTLNNDMTLKYRLGGSLRSKSRSPNIILALFYFTGNTHGVTRSRHRLMNNPPTSETGEATRGYQHGHLCVCWDVMITYWLLQSSQSLSLIGFRYWIFILQPCLYATNST